jgi:ankyrin repeat protein
MSRELHIACIAGDVDLVRALIKQGININHVDNNGYTPLHHANKKKNFRIHFVSCNIFYHQNK